MGIAKQEESYGKAIYGEDKEVKENDEYNDTGRRQGLGRLAETISECFGR